METTAQLVEPRQAIAWLAHPFTVAAIIVLAVNDHVLKPELGTWWTGKLSDVAGLVVAPALLAVALSLCVPRLPVRSLVPATIATVGLGFVIVKTTAAGAAAASAVWTSVAGPSVVLRDPTDLVALPALAAAWTVALRTGRRHPPATPRPPSATKRARAGAVLRWTLVLPAAIVATTATSMAAEDPSATQIAVLDGAVVAGTDEHPRTWITSTDGVTWTLVPADRVEQLTDQLDDAGGTSTTDCLRTRPDTCFRVVPGRLAVEASEDGGETWEVDWEVADSTRDVLARRFVGAGPSTLHTRGVAILPTASGFRVYAANAMDGLAVRHENGSWERLGFTPFPGWAETVEPLPRAEEGLAVPWAWHFGVLSGAIALVALAEAGRSPRTRERWRYALAVPTWAVGGLFLAASLALNPRAVGGRGPFFAGLFNSAGWLAVVLLLIGAAVLLSFGTGVTGRAGMATFGYAGALGVVTGVATAVTDGPPSVRLAVGAAVALAGTTAVLLVRRRTSAGAARSGPPIPPAPTSRTP